MRYISLSAQQGYAAAQFTLGILYEIGRGVGQNYELAYMWYDLAATLGEKASVDARNLIAEEMSQSQIDDAQRLAQQCRAANYLACAEFQ